MLLELSDSVADVILVMEFIPQLYEQARNLAFCGTPGISDRIAEEFWDYVNQNEREHG